ncbi:MAG TPA: ABC transporter substrate-binding protein [Candidatus Faecalibacterium faecipullorum]|uniref:ABC transporter substrate-binding protein n=1 Tax=Candidatus Faecalibacterium faecipullorum TaxID=2838578 RepID=A0A9D2MD03_9FIRM|nr:ABC transporter substrate-binding protein [Candidatus Faecalibacterium faecipullorum]
MMTAGKKKWALGLALALALLTGCVPAADPDAGAQAPQPAKQQAVTVLMPGASGADACARVSARLSRLTRARFGFDVEIEQVPAAEYESTLWVRMMSRQTADLFYLPAGQSIGSPIYEDCLAPLSALLAGRPALQAAFTDKQWDSRRYYRVVYAVPARASDCYQLGFWARADILEELGADPAGITTLSQLGGLLADVKQAHPEMTPVVADRGCVMPGLWQDPLNNDLGVLAGGSTTVVNWYAGDEYAALCRTMYRWARDGLVLREACLRTEPAADLMGVYDGFGWFARVGADSPRSRTLPDGTALTAILLGPMVQNSSGAADSWALPVHESKKEQALDLLELLYTDPEAAALFLYGQPDGQPDAGWSNDAVSFGCLGQGGGEGAQVSPAYGFVFNETDHLTRISACSAVVDQYHNALMCGYLDPEEALPLFLEGLRQAGIDQIIAGKQRQLDNWLYARRAG